MKIITKLGLFCLAFCWCLPLHALTLQTNASLNFGTTDYAPVLTGSISMGTSGQITYSGAFAGTGNGIAGQIEIIENNGTTVEISCTPGKLLGPGGHTIDIETTAVVGTGSTAAWGANPLCVNLSTPIITTTIGVGASANTLYIGGRLTPTSLQAGAYSTSGGGEAVQVRVLVQ